MSEKTFLWTGCCGDVVAGMAVMRQLGGGHLHIGNHWQCAPGDPCKPMKGIRYQSLVELLKAQPYVKSIKYDESRKVDYDMSDWREKYHRFRSLSHSQADYVGIKNIDVSPWVKTPSDPRSKGRIVVARSARYWSYSFPWINVGRRYKDRLLFVGLPEEHKDLEKWMARKVEYIPTKDLMEVAKLISGCDFMIANQSSPNWIALAMGKTLIQETYVKNPDSKIDRPNNQYIAGNNLKWI